MPYYRGTRGVRLTGTGWSPTFLLRDDFDTTEAAPLASPRTAEPGPGTWTITDAGNKLSVASGELVQAVPGGTEYATRIVSASHTRRCGVSMSGRVALTTRGLWQYGWSSASDGSTTNHTLNLYAGPGLVAAGPSYGVLSGAIATLNANETYKTHVILRSRGAWYVIGNQLLFVDDDSTTSTLYATLRFGSGVASRYDTLRVLQLPSPWDTDYGIAIDHRTGARAAGDAFAHSADGQITVRLTALPSAGDIIVRFRQQDADNYWRVRARVSGSGLNIDEVVDGVATNRATTALYNAGALHIALSGSSIRVNMGLSGFPTLAYSSATNFVTQTTGQIESLGTGGGASDLASWPRTLTGAAATYLDQAVA